MERLTLCQRRGTATATIKLTKAPVFSFAQKLTCSGLNKFNKLLATSSARLLSCLLEAPLILSARKVETAERTVSFDSFRQTERQISAVSFSA